VLDDEFHRFAHQAFEKVRDFGDNIWKLETREYVAIAHDVRSATTWRDKLGYIFGPPGWEPAGRGTMGQCASFSTATSTRD
jgi:hypothetical protein